MAYGPREASAFLGKPIEIYLWEGSFKNYFHTSSELPIVIGSDTYQNIAITRNAVKTTTQEDDGGDLEVAMPWDEELIQDYAYGIPPPKLVLTLTRWHAGDDPGTESAVLWKGQAVNFSVTDREAKVRIPSIFSRALRGDIPSVYYHSPCNNTLYDDICKVNPAGFTQNTTVSNIDGTTGIISVADDGFGDSFLKAGELVNDRNGERRLIIDNIANDLTVNIDFHDIIIGDAVTLRAGCDHDFATCRDKFSNVPNFTGDPYIPFENPFIGEL